MNIQFTKMHGLGNDFMVIDAVRQKISLTPLQIAQLSRRDTGVGFDQCLLIEPSSKPEIDFLYRIYNADGSEVGQCGNGARCLARFVQHYGLSTKKIIEVATQTTRMSLTINDDDTVTVDMGRPRIIQDSPPLTVNERVYHFHEIDLGNPHAVILINDILKIPVDTAGKRLSTNPYFPHQCNIGFMQIINPSHIQLRVYERGCGETQACGSGAVAASAIGMLHHGLENNVQVSLPGGDLMVHWPNCDSSIFLTGSATFVYEGVLFNH